LANQNHQHCAAPHCFRFLFTVESKLMNRMLLGNPRFLRTLGGMADLEQVMDRFLRDVPEGSDAVFAPSLDIAEREQSYEVTVDLPGVKPEDIRVEMIEDRLTIAGSRESKKEEKGKQFHRIERSTGAFSRTVILPAFVDSDKIEASYEEGVLHISLPKAEAHQPRRIQINSPAGQKRQDVETVTSGDGEPAKSKK
jgi:HSP20 family protein